MAKYLKTDYTMSQIREFHPEAPIWLETDTHYIVATPEELQEMQELEGWFRWYDTEVIKSLRRGTDISELQNQAEINASRLKELRGKNEKTNN